MRQEGQSRTIYRLGSRGDGLCQRVLLLAEALHPDLGDAGASGGILAMLADTMMPEAFQRGGQLVALATAVGFACACSHLAP